MPGAVCHPLIASAWDDVRENDHKEHDQQQNDEDMRHVEAFLCFCLCVHVCSFLVVVAESDFCEALQSFLFQ